MAKSESTKIEFGYFHDYESEQFAFYRIPKVLFTDEYFRNLSSDAKVLYGLMLDRMALSIRHQWFDEEGKVYIIFTVEQVIQYMNCGRDKAMKTLAELDTKKGIGLIERVKQGFGKPDIIYVKNFATIGEAEEETPANADVSTEVQDLNLKSSKSYTSRSSETELQEVQKADFQKSKNFTSRSTISELAEVQYNKKTIDMKLSIAVLPGDGIGPEIMTEGVKVMKVVAEKFGHEFSFKEAICGAHAIDEVGDPFPEETFQTCLNADAVLFAAVGDPRFDNDPTAKVRPEQGLLAMRKKLGLFANVRPVATFDCLLHKSPLKDELLKGADFVVIRELTGGMYFGEKYQDNDKAYDTDIYTRPEIERILKVAFEFAMKRNKHLTVVDKANVLASSRLWRQIAKEMEPQYPEVNTDYMFIDNASMRVLTEPRFFDVIVTENTFGDILTDETSCITGSMGLQPSSSLGEHTPLFEPVHGSWPQAAGKNLANPVAQILSAAMLLEHFGLNEEGALVRKAVDASLDANVRTPEIQVEGGAQYGTAEVGQWIADYIAKA